MVDIFVPTHRGVKIPAKQVFPSAGELILDCVCGSRRFGIHVRPKDGTAYCTEIVCAGCSRVWRVTPEGAIDAQGIANGVKNDGGNH